MNVRNLLRACATGFAALITGVVLALGMLMLLLAQLVTLVIRGF